MRQLQQIYRRGVIICFKTLIALQYADCKSLHFLVSSCKLKMFLCLSSIVVLTLIDDKSSHYQKEHWDKGIESDIKVDKHGDRCIDKMEKM